MRFQDGRRTSGNLQLVSVTGGLLSLPRPLNQGSRVKLMFLTQTGPVLGAAELLSPVSQGLQPFRFLQLQEGDRQRLRATIESVLVRHQEEQRWIDKYRSAVGPKEASRIERLRKFFGSVILGIIGVSGIFFLLRLYWLT
jgi:hypothetical protein